MINITLDDIIESEQIDSVKAIRENISKCIILLLGDSIGCDLSIRFVDDKEIKIINSETRGKKTATDVLSFPLYDSSIKLPHQDFGEIIISIETLRKQAQEIGHSNKDELYRLLVHGLLHLIGYDHEKSSKEEEIMKAKEDECLSLIFIS
jgi:probable rRNA maturation factor